MGNGRVYKRANRFTQVSNAALRDETFDLDAKGLYGVINSYLTIPNFTLYKTFLQAHGAEGKKAFESTWKKLKNSGYFIQHKLKNPETGEFYYEYELLDEKVQTPLLEGVDKADMEKVGAGEGGSINNTEVKNTEHTNTIKNNTHTDPPKPAEANIPADNPNTGEKTVCVDNSIILQGEIKKTTGYKVPLKKVRELLTNSSVDRIQYHLASWHIHKQHQKSEGAGWFFTVIEHDIEPEEKKTGGTGKKREEKAPQPEFFTATREKIENMDSKEKRALSEAATTAISSMYQMLGVRRSVNR